MHSSVTRSNSSSTRMHWPTTAMHSRRTAYASPCIAMHSLGKVGNCVRCRYDPGGTTFSSRERNEGSGDTAIHCFGIAIDPRRTCGHLSGTRLELRATHVTSSGTRSHLTVTTRGPGAGRYSLGVTALNSSATRTHRPGQVSDSAALA